jgi:hypothetical protein
MTVSSNFALNLMGEDIVKAALRLAGKGDDKSSETLVNGILSLNIIIKSLQKRGFILRTKIPTVLPLIAGTASYQLPAGTIDVEPPAMAITANGSESLVLPMGLADWTRLVDKTTPGIPTRFYPRKADVAGVETVTLFLWNVPTADAVSLRYTGIRALKNIERTTVPDLSERWLDALLYSLAHVFGMEFGDSVERMAYYKAMAEQAIKASFNDNTETADVQFHTSAS